MGRIKTRDDSFEEARAFFLMHHKIILEYCTGYGKTYQALKLIFESLSTKKEKWAIIVPTQNLIKGWKDEITKWGYEKMQDHIQIECYASIHKLKDCKHFCLDECHNITELRTEKLLDLIDKRNSKLIGLSATIDVEKFSLLKYLGFIKKHRHKITLEEAAEADVITEYKIIGLPVKPNEVWEKTLRGIEYWLDSAKLKNDQGQIEMAILKRMRHVYDSANKFKLALFVLQNLTSGDKALVYVANINQAKLLSEATGFPAYHSKISKKKRAQMLEDFNKQKEGVLISCYTLNEGANIVGVNKCFIFQVRRNERETIQRLGRILRMLGKSKGSKGVCYIAYLEGTPDETWFLKAIKSLKKENISTRIVDPKHYHSKSGVIPNQ